MEAHYATIWEAIADTIGDDDAIVQGDVRRTWSRFEGRAARMAGALAEAGLQPDSKVGLYLYNSPEYLETYFAAFKQRAVPVNVNYRYLDDELTYLLENSDSEVVVFHSSLGDRVGRVRERLPLVRRWIEVADDDQHLDGAERYEDVVASTDPAPRIERSAEDIAMIYTGGTTGMPKGVMSHVGAGVMVGLTTLPPLLGLAPHQPDDVPATVVRLSAEDRRPVSLVTVPLMHGTGIGIGSNPSMTMGGCILLLAGRTFDGHEVWALAERERATAVTVVGDTLVWPMVRALDEGPKRDLSSLLLVASAGTMFSREMKDALVAHIPQLFILDLMASTEGGMATSIHTRAAPAETASFRLDPSARVFNQDDRPVEPGSGEIGMLGVTGSVPFGYYKDPEKSARTFRVIDGQRWSFPGDFATVEADGSITLLGRGSGVINTGGEKVFAEEVEEVLKTHPAVEDCLVVGVADERFGQRVTAVLSFAAAEGAAAGDLVAHAKERLASYKAPRRIVVVEEVPRAPNGKADYTEAKRLAAEG